MFYIKILLIVNIAVLTYCIVYMFLVKAVKDKLVQKERLEQIRKMFTISRSRKGTNAQKKSGIAEKMHLTGKLSTAISLSGINVKQDDLVMIWIFVTLAPFALVFALTLNVISATIVGVLGLIAPVLFIKYKIGGRRKLFERQLGDALIIISNGLRAGFSFPQALGNVSQNMSDPISSEFAAASREMQLGVDIETAFIKVTERMQSSDLRLLTSAVVIQQQVGGNLADILETIAQTIRDRMKIKRLVNTLTAQGRISGKILGALPVFILLAVAVITPSYVEPLFKETLGNAILVAGGTLELVGFAVISRIVDIKF